MKLSRASPVLDLIGNTPTLPLQFEPEGLTVYVKCEFLNPSGSIKDRFAAAVVTDAERRGLLRPDSIILECTSGNTGIALSMIGAARGYRVTILMSEEASHERRQLIRQFGAELILFKSEGRYQTGITLSREMAAGDSRYFLPRQFENPLNADDHELSTGQEILRQVPGPICRATRIAAVTFAPEEVPTNRPNWRLNRRAIATASALVTLTSPSMGADPSKAGMKPSAIPSIR